MVYFDLPFFVADVGQMSFFGLLNIPISGFICFHRNNCVTHKGRMCDYLF